jgi:hypothetical protein
MDTSKTAVFVKASQVITAALQGMFLTEETGDGSSKVQFFNLDDPVFGKAEIQFRDGELLFFHIITPEGQVLRQQVRDGVAEYSE